VDVSTGRGSNPISGWRNGSGMLDSAVQLKT